MEDFDTISIEINLLRCMARKQDGGQCTRNKKKGFDYCGKHNENRKWGRIDEHTKMELKTKETKFSVSPIVIDDKSYFIDSNKVVFEEITKKPLKMRIIGILHNDILIKLDSTCRDSPFDSCIEPCSDSASDACIEHRMERGIESGEAID
jgi:hypothetical protein